VNKIEEFAEGITHLWVTLLGPNNS